MAKDLRSFIEMIKREAPEQFLEVEKEIDSRYEIPALLQCLEEKGQYPMVLFHHVKNINGKSPSLRLITNVGAARARIAMAIDSTISEVAIDYVNREQHPLQPIVVDKKNALVKEVILKGREADLFDLPIVTHHEMDVGPYISAGSAWTKDPDRSQINCAVVRMWAKEPQKLVVPFGPAGHTYTYHKRYAARNEPMPMAVVIGHHLAFYIGAQTQTLGAEMGTIGAMLGEPLEVVPSETWGDDFCVPAQAEIVIETEVLPNKLEIEAPFGEYTGYYGGQRLSHVAVVKAITRRRDAIYQDLFPGHRDHLIMDGPKIEANILAKLREVVPTVANVYMPPSGKCRFHLYVQLKKMDEGEPKSIIATAFTAEHHIKHVWVVDDDIDIYDEDQVLWAMATRFQGDRGMVTISNMLGSKLDPSLGEKGMAKVGFDCTKPAPPQRFAKKVAISSQVLEKVRTAAYLTKGAR